MRREEAPWYSRQRGMTAAVHLYPFPVPRGEAEEKCRTQLPVVPRRRRPCGGTGVRYWSLFWRENRIPSRQPGSR